MAQRSMLDSIRLANSSFSLWIPCTTADNDFYTANCPTKMRVLQFECRVFGGNGTGVNTATLTNGASSISDDVDVNINDNLIARPVSLDDAYDTIAAGGTLRVVLSDNTKSNVIAHVILAPEA